MPPHTTRGSYGEVLDALLAGDYGAERFEYYCTPRAQHPRSMKERAWKSIDKTATFDAYAPIPLIGPTEPYWVDGASHNDLYDKPQLAALVPKADARRARPTL
jgi:hypothetical protein